MNLILKKSNCEFDSCRSGPCSSLEQAADECKNAGFCVDWRNLTNGRCGKYFLFSVKQSQSDRGQIIVLFVFAQQDNKFLLKMHCFRCAVSRRIGFQRMSKQAG